MNCPNCGIGLWPSIGTYQFVRFRCLQCDYTIDIGRRTTITEEDLVNIWSFMNGNCSDACFHDYHKHHRKCSKCGHYAGQHDFVETYIEPNSPYNSTLFGKCLSPGCTCDGCVE